MTARQGAFVGRCARAFGHFFDGTASSDRDEEGPEMQQQNCNLLDGLLTEPTLYALLRGADALLIMI